MILNLKRHNGSDSKEFACNVGDWGSIQGLERYPEEGNGISTAVSLSGKIPWTEETARLESMVFQRVRHD